MSENLIDKGERGFYHKKNPLNDLTGKEWVYFTNSMLETDFENDEEFRNWLNYISDSVIEIDLVTLLVISAFFDPWIIS